jgi:hypothetical protein
MYVLKGGNSMILIIVICLMCCFFLLAIGGAGYYFMIYSKSNNANQTSNFSGQSRQPSSLPSSVTQIKIGDIYVPSNYIYNIISDPISSTASKTSDPIYGPKGQSYIANIDSSKYCKPNSNLLYECLVDPIELELELNQYDPEVRRLIYDESYSFLNNGQNCPRIIQPYSMRSYNSKFQISCVDPNGGKHQIDIPTDACDSGYSLKGNNFCVWDAKPTCSNNGFLDDLNNKCHNCPIGNYYIDNTCYLCLSPNSIIGFPQNSNGKDMCLSKCPDGYGLLKYQDDDVCIDMNWTKKNSLPSTYDQNGLLRYQLFYNNLIDEILNYGRIQK